MDKLNFINHITSQVIIFINEQENFAIDITSISSEITTALNGGFSGAINLHELISLMGYFKGGMCA